MIGYEVTTLLADELACLTWNHSIAFVDFVEDSEPGDIEKFLNSILLGHL